MAADHYPGFAAGSGRVDQQNWSLRRTRSAYHKHAASSRRWGWRPGLQVVNVLPISSSGLVGLRRHVLLEQGIYVHPLVILPRSPWYMCWWYFTVVAAVLTAVFVPVQFAFTDYPGWGPYTDLLAYQSYILTAVFTLDIFVQIFVAHYNYEDHTVTLDPWLNFKLYCSWQGPLDIIATVPWDVVVLASLGYQDSGSPGPDGNIMPSWIAILAWLKLIRLHRLIELFTKHMEYNLKVSQLVVTLVRNHVYLVLLLHASACWFYWVARIKGFSDDTWLANNFDLVASQNITTQYIYCLYFCVTTFATVGYGDIHAYTIPEVMLIMVLMMINMVMSSYILGTITVLVVRADERTKEYRQAMGDLEEYAAQNKVPSHLLERMREHLEVTLAQAQSASDEDILDVHPSIIRRRVLRYLYYDMLQSCYLFQGVPSKMIIAILSAARIEKYLPQVDILTEGDTVSELCLLVQGTVTVLPADQQQQPGGQQRGRRSLQLTLSHKSTARASGERTSDGPVAESIEEADSNAVSGEDRSPVHGAATRAGPAPATPTAGGPATPLLARSASQLAAPSSSGFAVAAGTLPQPSEDGRGSRGEVIAAAAAGHTGTAPDTTTQEPGSSVAGNSSSSSSPVEPFTAPTPADPQPSSAALLVDAPADGSDQVPSQSGSTAVVPGSTTPPGASTPPDAGTLSAAASTQPPGSTSAEAGSGPREVASRDSKGSSKRSGELGGGWHAETPPGSAPGAGLVPRVSAVRLSVSDSKRSSGSKESSKGQAGLMADGGSGAAPPTVSGANAVLVAFQGGPAAAATTAAGGGIGGVGSGPSPNGSPLARSGSLAVSGTHSMARSSSLAMAKVSLLPGQTAFGDLDHMGDLDTALAIKNSVEVLTLEPSVSGPLAVKVNGTMLAPPPPAPVRTWVGDGDRPSRPLVRPHMSKAAVHPHPPRNSGGQVHIVPGKPGAVQQEDDDEEEGPQLKTLGPGDTFGEVAFFTEFPMQETIIANETCRVLTLPRDQWQSILSENPEGAKLVLANLQRFFQARLQEEIRAAKAAKGGGGGAGAGGDGSSHVVTVGYGETGDSIVQPGTPAKQQYAQRQAADTNGDEGGGEGGGSRPGSPSHQWPSLFGKQDSGKNTTHVGTINVPSTTAPQQGRVSGDRQQPVPLKQPIKLVPAPVMYDEDDEEFDRFSRGGPGHTSSSMVLIQEPPKSARGAAPPPPLGRVDEDMALDQGTLAALGPAGAALLKSAKRIKSTVQEYQSKVESLTSGEVIAAAAKNDLAKLKKAIEAGTNLDTSDHDGRTALHAAAAAGHLDAVRLLLDAHAHPALQDTMGLTPLFMACAKGHGKVVHEMASRGLRLGMEGRVLLPHLLVSLAEGTKTLKRLLRAGADPNLQDLQGRTLLMLAALRNQGDAAKLLLAAGGDPNIPDHQGRTPLMVAAAEGYAQMVVELTNGGADASRHDREGRTALFEACRSGGSRVVEVLVAAGAKLMMDEKTLGAQVMSAVFQHDMPVLRRLVAAKLDPDVQDASGMFPLMAAALRNHADIASLLLEAGATVDATDEWGRTALIVAASKGHAETVSVLKNKGADTSRKDFKGGHALLEACLSGHEPTVNLLLERGAKLHLEEAALFNTLTQAVSLGSSAAGGDHLRPLRLLLKAGADANCVDYQGRTPLHVAAGRGSEDAVALLLDYGGKYSLKDGHGLTPLLEACRAGQDAVIRVFTSRNIRVEQDDTAAANALCLAVGEGDLKQVRRLLSAGVNPNTPNLDQRTALHVAAGAGSLPAVQVLIEEGKANHLVKDRQGVQPVDNARYVGAKPVVSYLEPLMAKPAPDRPDLPPPPPEGVVPAPAPTRTLQLMPSLQRRAPSDAANQVKSSLLQRMRSVANTVYAAQAFGATLRRETSDGDRASSQPGTTVSADGRASSSLQQGLVGTRSSPGFSSMAAALKQAMENERASGAARDRPSAPAGVGLQRAAGGSASFSPLRPTAPAPAAGSSSSAAGQQERAAGGPQQPSSQAAG